jgi:hypothetical protein
MPLSISIFMQVLTSRSIVLNIKMKGASGARFPRGNRISAGFFLEGIRGFPLRFFGPGGRAIRRPARRRTGAGNELSASNQAFAVSGLREGVDRPPLHK